MAIRNQPAMSCNKLNLKGQFFATLKNESFICSNSVDSFSTSVKVNDIMNKSDTCESFSNIVE